MKSRVYEKNEPILRSGDRVYSLLKIESGIVLVYNEARSRVVNLLTKDDYLGDVEFCLNLEFQLEAIALNRVTISRDNTHCCNNILYQCHQSYNNIVRVLNTHGMNGKQKAIAGLIWFVENAKLTVTDNKVAAFPFSDYILSDIAGMTRETCTRAIAPLVRDGVVRRVKGGLAIERWSVLREVDLSGY